MGGSYGGFMTGWIISHYPNMFKSSIVERALLNWETMVGTSDIGIGFPEMYLLDELDKNINLFRKKSPITYANNIICPTFIIHSENDYRCPIEQGEQLFSNLKRRNIEILGLVVNGEKHLDNPKTLVDFSGIPLIAEFPYIKKMNSNNLDILWKELEIKNKSQANSCL